MAEGPRGPPKPPAHPPPGHLQLARIPGNGRPVTAITFDRSGKLLLFGSEDGLIRGWSSTAYEPVLSLRGHAAPVTHLDTSVGGALASADDTGRVRVWNLTRRTISRTLQTLSPHALAWTPDGKLLATADDEMIHLWDLNTGLEALQIGGYEGQPTDLAFSPRGDRLYTTSTASNALIWGISGGK